MKKEKLFSSARKLRRNGHSLREISEKLSISKSTASLWLKNISISKKGLRRLDMLSEQGRGKAKLILRKRRVEHLRIISDRCKALKEGKNYNKQDLKVFLALLYWGEGAKTGRRIVFMNSDPVLICTYLGIFRKAYKLNEDLFRAVLHLHSYHDKDEMIRYWSKLTKISKNRISIYKKKNSGIRKKDGYMGCISIRYGDSRILDEIFIIIDRFQNKFADVG